MPGLQRDRHRPWSELMIGRGGVISVSTIICYLERRRPIRLLPDKEPATAQAWLAGQPQIEIVAHDRGAATGDAGRRPLAFDGERQPLDAVRKSMRQIRAAIGAAAINLICSLLPNAFNTRVSATRGNERSNCRSCRYWRLDKTDGAGDRT